MCAESSPAVAHKPSVTNITYSTPYHALTTALATVLNKQAARHFTKLCKIVYPCESVSEIQFYQANRLQSNVSAAGTTLKSNQGSAEPVSNMPSKAQTGREQQRMSQNTQSHLLYPVEMTLHGWTSCCA